MSKNPSIAKAVDTLGGLSATAKVVGAKGYQTVQQWLVTGRVPAKYCVKLAEASGVSVYQLRPDDAREIWPALTEVR